MNPASRFHTFYTVSASVGWPRLEFQTCKLGTACARKSRGTSSEWTEAAGATVGKEKRGDPAREQRKRHAPSKRGVWSQEGDAQLGRPVKSLPRAQVRPSSGLGHAQHWADSPGHPLRPELRGCNLGPLLVLWRTFRVFPALYRPLSPFYPPAFFGTDPIPGSCGGRVTQTRPIRTNGTQFQELLNCRGRKIISMRHPEKARLGQAVATDSHLPP